MSYPRKPIPGLRLVEVPGGADLLDSKRQTPNGGGDETSVSVEQGLELIRMFHALSAKKQAAVLAYTKWIVGQDT